MAAAGERDRRFCPERGGNAAVHGTKTQRRRAALFLMPSVALLGFFFIWPILLSFYFSMTDMTLSGSKSQAYSFVGFQNFERLLSDPLFIRSFGNTLSFLVFSAIIGQMTLGFLIALMMKGKSRGLRSFTGVAVLAGWIAPEVIVSFCFVAFFGASGTLNASLQWLGVLQKPISWLVTFPMVSVIVANIWHGTAFSMLQFQAALDDIPKEVEEAASVDGAGGMRRFLFVTLPMVRGAIMTDGVLITLRTLGVFGLIYAMTGGGPGTKSTTLSIYMYKQAFSSYQMGYGTAIALALLLVGVVFSLIYVRLTKLANGKERRP